MRFQHLLFGCIVSFALMANGMNTEKVVTKGKLPDVYHPTRYKVYNTDRQIHYENDSIPNYSDDHYVLLDPAKFSPGKLQARRAQRIEQLAQGKMTEKDYELEEHNDEVLDSAMKTITFPSDLYRGAVKVNNANDVYYHQDLSEKEVERRAKDNQIAVIWSDKGRYWLHFPWLETDGAGPSGTTLDNRSEEASTLRYRGPKQGSD